MSYAAQKTKYLQVRITPELKNEVEPIFERLGLTATQAVKLFFSQVAMRKSIPFDLSIPEEMVSEEEERGIGKSLEQIKNGNFTRVDMKNKKQVEEVFGV